MLARTDDAQRRDVTQRCADSDCEVTPRDEMHRVARISIVEHHLASCELAPTPGLDENPPLVVTQRTKKPGFHIRSLAENVSSHHRALLAISRIPTRGGP